MRKRAIAAATITGSLVFASALAMSEPASATPSPKAVPNSKPSWTAHARNLGPASNSAKINGRVYLQPQGGVAALKAAAAAVSTPGNAAYGKYLTPSQYYARYGTTPATVGKVRNYLRSSGLQVTSVGAHNRYLTITGTVAQAEKAFGAQIQRFTHNGQTVMAPRTSLTVPADLASSVLTVYGLDTSVNPMRRASDTPNDAPPGGFRSARPCSLYYGQLQAKYQADHHTPLPKFDGKTLAYAPCGYTGPLYRAAYEGNTGLDGSGVEVAVVDAYAAPTIASDADRYAQAHGDGAYAPGQLTQTVPAKSQFIHKAECGPSGWYGEETLDVEAVHAMAPGANIHYYGARSCYDLDLADTLQKVADDGTAKIVTNSYGNFEYAVDDSIIQANEAAFLQGALEGQSYLFSSGDDGDDLAATGIKQTDYPASDPYVTAVGGTSLGINYDGSKIFETGWGTEKYSLSPDGTSWNPVGFVYGGGGGSSALFNRPAYQDNSTSAGSRQVPDVSMDGDPNTGMLVGETQTFPDGVYYDEYRIGGTSLSSPLFAGMTALAFQRAGRSVGLLNPTIYTHHPAFTDVTGAGAPVGEVRVDYVNGLDPTNGLAYSVRLFNRDASLVVTKGYDQVTGIGAANPLWLNAISKH